MVELLEKRALQGFIYERRLAGAGDSGHDRERADGEVGCDVLEVVLGAAGDGESFELEF